IRSKCAKRISINYRLNSGRTDPPEMFCRLYPSRVSRLPANAYLIAISGLLSPRSCLLPANSPGNDRPASDQPHRTTAALKCRGITPGRLFPNMDCHPRRKRGRVSGRKPSFTAEAPASIDEEECWRKDRDDEVHWVLTCASI